MSLLSSPSVLRRFSAACATGIRSRLGSVGYPACCQASKPPFSGRTSFHPRAMSSCATRALECSFVHVQKGTIRPLRGISWRCACTSSGGTRIAPGICRSPCRQASSARESRKATDLPASIRCFTSCGVIRSGSMLCKSVQSGGPKKGRPPPAFTDWRAHSEFSAAAGTRRRPRTDRTCGRRR